MTKLKKILNKNLRRCRALVPFIFDNSALHNLPTKNLYQFVAKHDDIDIEEMSPVEADDLIYAVNRQIKDPDTPSNLRHRFYKLKHRYILKHIRLGHVERVLESESCYHFFIKGLHDYHQLKSTFPGGFEKIDGTEEYIQPEQNEKFNPDDYKRAIVQLIMFNDY